jgi:hypothetical protein
MWEEETERKETVNDSRKWTVSSNCLQECDGDPPLLIPGPLLYVLLSHRLDMKSFSFQYTHPKTIAFQGKRKWVYNMYEKKLAVSPNDAKGNLNPFSDVERFYQTSFSTKWEIKLRQLLLFSKLTVDLVVCFDWQNRLFLVKLTMRRSFGACESHEDVQLILCSCSLLKSSQFTQTKLTWILLFERVNEVTPSVCV